jgi:AcrR family transcriptional regulator
LPVAAELVRPWRGVSAEQRIAARRERLLAAALEVFATRGFHASKVRDVCHEAGLTERYFYESFDEKETLLATLGERIVADFVAAAGPSLARLTTEPDAAIAGAARAIVHSLTDDPRRARIVFVEVVGVSPALEDRRRAVIGSLVDVIRTAAREGFGAWARESVEVELVARAVVGAGAELLVAYVRREMVLDQDDLIEHLGNVLMRARPLLEAMASQRASTEHGDRSV